MTETVDDLRERGYCVVIFNPDELEGADPDQVEDRLIELGWEVISILSTQSQEVN